jgi:hypothetical protein
MRFILFFLMLTVTVAGDSYAQNTSTAKQSFIYQDHGKKDPFWPLISSTGNIINYDTDLSVTDMALEGIMLGANGNAVAIVNGKVVKKGDKMGDFIVDSIDKDFVVFSKGEEKFELRLKKKED